LRLDGAFVRPSAGVRLTRHHSVTGGSPTFETCTTYTSLAGAQTLADLSALELTVPNGAVR